MTLTAMPKYEAYRDSGEEWIAEIPEHWTVQKLKHIFQEKKHTQNMSLTCGAISFGQVIEKGDEKVTEATKKSYQEVLSGEFLINPLNLNYDLISLRIALSTINVVVSAGYIVLKNKISINKDYFKYLLHRYDVAYMKLLGSGVRQTISFNHIANSLLVIPPINEQTAIANFLDTKTTQIDEAIAIKEQQIALLNERKQILIQQAVTQGLDPTVPMKDSGVEWIGKIPEHWSCAKLKLVCHFILDGTHGSYPRVDTGYRLLSVRNIINDEFVFRDDDSNVSYKHFKEISSKFKIMEGDIQLAIVGATLGKVAVVKRLEEDVVTQRSLATIRVNSALINNSFAANFLRSKSYENYLWSNTSFSAQPGVYLNTIQNSYIPIAPKPEQDLIDKYIDDELKKINGGIENTQTTIDKLREYKTTLINSAVTGKIKVV